MGTGIRLTPYPSKFQVNFEGAGQDKYWSQNTTYDDVLFANGQHIQTYADISHLAKGLMYSKMGITESTTLSPLFEYVTGDGGIETITKNWVRWKIYGTPEKRALSFGNYNNIADPGMGGIPFYLWLDVDWYKEGDHLSPIANKNVVGRITEADVVPFDGGFRYEAVLIDADEAASVPEEYFAAGEYWIKTGTSTSWEMAGTAGSIQFGDAFSYIEFETPLNTSMWEFKVEAEAHRQWGNLRITRCDDEHNPIPGGSKITNYLEVKANAQIEREKELMLTYGRKQEHLIDRNTAKQITTGAGLFEFLEEGNVVPYSPEVNGIQFIVDQIEALWFDRVPTGSRELLLLTGQAGLKLFSDWIAEKFGESAATYSWDFILQRRTPFDARGGRNGFAYAAPQFVEYILPTFGSIKVAHWKLLDNTRITGVTYPGTIYPVTSYEFVAFNIGFGESNVKFLKRDDNMISTYIPGFWSPFGAVGLDNPYFKQPSYFEESYKWIHKESFGVVVLDPLQSLFFKPNISY